MHIVIYKLNLANVHAQGAMPSPVCALIGCTIFYCMYFSPSSYHILDHNCNTFSNEITKFLTGRSIPQKIVSLPSDVMNT